jgi:hypothetical protein
MKVKVFWNTYLFYEFSTQFPKTVLKAFTLYSVEVLSQEDSKFAELVLEAFFFTSNAIILQSMWSIFLKPFLHITLII